MNFKMKIYFSFVPCKDFSWSKTYEFLEKFSMAFDQGSATNSWSQSAEIAILLSSLLSKIESFPELDISFQPNYNIRR